MQVSSVVLSQNRAVEQRYRKIQQRIKELSTMDFMPIEDEAEAKAIEQGAITRGAYEAFLTNLHKWYQENWDESKPCVIYLNREGENDPFTGKKTDSLYTALLTQLKKHKDAKDGWRLVKRTKGEVTNLVILHK